MPNDTLSGKGYTREGERILKKSIENARWCEANTTVLVC